MKENNIIPINIWDDFYDDGYVPVGKKQETYIYVEDINISHENRKKYLEYLLNYINKNIDLPKDVKMWLEYYESKQKYPNLVGTEHEWCLFERWEIKVENLTHENLNFLLKELKKAKLSYDNIPFRIYSES